MSCSDQPTWRIPEALIRETERIRDLEEALETLLDEYQCQVGYDRHYDKAFEILYNKTEKKPS